MKNKIVLKKYLIITTIICLAITSIFIFILFNQYKKYTINYNRKIEEILSNVKEKYPNVTDKEIIDILDKKSTTKTNIFKKYGIDINDSSVLLENTDKYYKYIIEDGLIIILYLFIIFLIFMMYLNSRDKDLKEITKSIQEINKRNYELQLDSNTEDELSILKSEIYKTTIMLKEAAENSNKDKTNLKKSLEDISHQLKTPLTSILVMLDNIIEDPDMEESVRNDFIADIKRNVVNINFLVQNILKLSKFDANTITFIKDDYSIQSIIKESIKNVSPLCDLKDINIEFNLKKDSKIFCDYKWQVEAITNILKNAIEHSNNNDKVIINTNDNSVYSLIEIINNGKCISKKDIQHIFERFYKGENAKSDSVGIGLALAKTIIEEDKGSINVESDNNQTKFSIKYFKI